MATRPKTGEARKTDQPFNIDRLPVSVHESITYLHNDLGKSFKELERRSMEPAGKGQLGYVDWAALDPEVLALFPERRIPDTSLHRWYDVRVKQVSQRVRERSAQARELAVVFSSSVMDNADEAVLNATRDTILSALAEDGTAKGRLNVGKALLSLAEVMQKVRSNDIKERKVAVEEQTLQMKLDLLKRKAGELIEAAEGADAGTPALTREEIIARMKEVYGVV